MNENLEYEDIDELKEIIDCLNNKLEKLKGSKKAICQIVLKEKELLHCSNCHSTNINKMESIKKDKIIFVKTAIKSLMI